MNDSGSQKSNSPSQLVDARIKELGDWRGKMLGRLRADALNAATTAMHAEDTPVKSDAELVGRAGAVTPSARLASHGPAWTRV